MATYTGTYSGPSLAFPTIVPFPAFHTEADVQALQHALKGIGTDDETIIVVLANRSSVQRQEIAQMYKVMTGNDLNKDLKSKLTHNFKETVAGLMLPLAKFDAE
uniref:annexin n=1 Tax=Salmonella sp. s51228 TaxID=3159652 RepID=UPI0039811EC6